jgi:hypothetical protein
MLITKQIKPNPRRRQAAMFSGPRERARRRSTQWSMVASATFAMFAGISSIPPVAKARSMVVSEVTQEQRHAHRD